MIQLSIYSISHIMMVAKISVDEAICPPFGYVAQSTVSEFLGMIIRVPGTAPLLKRLISQGITDDFPMLLYGMRHY